MSGLSFRDIHSSTFNTRMLSIDRSMFPELRKREMIIPGRHGTIDFEDNTYEKRIIIVQFSISENGLNAIRLKLRQLAAWLQGKGKLIFDDEPDKYYIAKVYSSISPSDIAAAVGIFTVEFECQPFALFQVTSGEDVLLDSDLPLDSDILLDPVDAYTIDVTDNTNFDIDYWGTQELCLGSPEGSQFKIIIEGSFTTLSITLNGKTINYTEAVVAGTVEIDNVDATVELNGTNALTACTGDLMDFLKLIYGTNTATITGTGLNCSVLFDFRPQYL